MNPARSFGLTLVAWDWGNHWINWVGPGVGAALAALGYRFAFLSPAEAVFEEADIEIEEADSEKAGECLEVSGLPRTRPIRPFPISLG